MERKSIWTKDDNPVELTVGDAWYVRMPGEGAELVSVRILDLTDATVQIMKLPSSYHTPRFEHGYLQWIEKIEALSR